MDVDFSSGESDLYDHGRGDLCYFYPADAVAGLLGFGDASYHIASVGHRYRSGITRGDEEEERLIGRVYMFRPVAKILASRNRIRSSHFVK